MAWENVITGYQLKRFEGKDIIPVDAKFVTVQRGSVSLGGFAHPYIHYVYQVPIYEKKNIKRK
jgi:hypothetical protein